MRGLPHAVLAWLAVLPIAAPAQVENDFLVTSGKLTQGDFYALLSCRAMPGGPCTEDSVRWPAHLAQNLGVGFAPVPPDYPRQLAIELNAALDLAIAEINGAASALQMTRASKGAAPPISIFLSASSQGEPIRGTGIRGVDGEIIGAALVTVWWDDRNQITEAVIVLAADLPHDEALPVLLEELTQALGLLTDIRNPVYRSISVFSEDSNAVTKLGPQDRGALLLHYPPK